MRKSGKKKSERDPLDRYYTPNWVIDQCLDMVVPEVLKARPMVMLEPSAGDGAFLGPWRTRYPDNLIYAVDVDPAVGPWEHADHSYEGDFQDIDWEQLLGNQLLDVIVGNPPYNRAIEFVEQALEICENVIFILRVDFLASARRAHFFRSLPPSHVFMLPNRPTFYGPAMKPPYTMEPREGQTGEYDYAWICWSPMGDGQKTKLYWLPEVPVQIRRKQ